MSRIGGHVGDITDTASKLYIDTVYQDLSKAWNTSAENLQAPDQTVKSG